MDVPLTVGDKLNKISGACCSLKFLKVLLSKECWTSLLKEQNKSLHLPFPTTKKEAQHLVSLFWL